MQRTFRKFLYVYYLNLASLARQRFNVQPKGFNVQPTGFNVQLKGFNVQPKGLRRDNSDGFGIGSPNKKYHYVTRTSKSMYTHRKLNVTSFEAVQEGGAGHGSRGFLDLENAQLSCPLGSGFCFETGFNPYLVTSRVQP